MTQLYSTKNGKLTQIAQTRLSNEDQLQGWIAENPALIGLDLLVLGREISTDFGGRIDILGLDEEGNTVIIECKRGQTPRDVIAQILDYASWIARLNTRRIHEIAQLKLGKSLPDAFRERFGSTLPEELNRNHNLLIVASEFDASSRRIVEYLAENYEMSINTAFFTTFEHKGEILLATDWLLDQEEVTQRAERRAQAPWTGLWYYNVGQDEHRAWEDMRRYGFIAAGGGLKYTNPLKNLSVGDQFCAYQKGMGYVGYGIVKATSVSVNEFTVNGSPILNLPLEAKDFGHDAEDLLTCEYLVAVEWRMTFPLNEAKFFQGAFANQNIVCKLRQTATVEFLRREFSIGEDIEMARARAATS